MKKAADMEECLFKMNDFYVRKTTVLTRLPVDTGATTCIIRDAKKLKNYDRTCQLENCYMELADDTKTSSVASKRGDSEVGY